MKKFLFPAFCLLIALINSCTLEIQAEATKFSIKNNSKVNLKDVKWSGEKFGDIARGDVVEINYQAGKTDTSRLDFYVVNNGNKAYKTKDAVIGLSSRTNVYELNDKVIVLDDKNKEWRLEVIANPTKFSITNNSEIALQNVRWGNVSFGLMNRGATSEKEVSEGGAPICFKYIGSSEYCTSNLHTVDRHDTYEITINNNTLVSLSGSPGTLACIVLNQCSGN